MTLPRQSGKTTLADLPGIATQALDPDCPLPADRPLLLHEEVGGFRFDWLWRPFSGGGPGGSSEEGTQRLFVLFSGDAMRSQNNPPVFQRWSWAPHFPGHCLYVSDPALHLHPRLGLAWYAGTEDFDPMDVIADRVTRIATLLGLSADDVFGYGSSGGGFAALRLAARLPGTGAGAGVEAGAGAGAGVEAGAGAGAVAVNPQVVVTDFAMKNTELYLDICLGGRDRAQALADFPDRLSLMHHLPALRQRRLIHIQNRLDHHHFDAHFTPFARAMGGDMDGDIGENTDAGSYRRLLFSDPRGHGKAETPEVFARAMAIIRDNFSAAPALP